MLSYFLDLITYLINFFSQPFFLTKTATKAIKHKITEEKLITLILHPPLLTGIVSSLVSLHVLHV